MQIKSIELKNEIGIFNGMGLTKIKIDIDTANDINLICGTNGSGKTSFQKSLNPFFTENIRKDHSGGKKIIYEKGKYTYLIQHVVSPTKTGHSVKSYISKYIDKKDKMKELNPNGNQSSFLEVIEEELHVTPDEIKLLNLGNDMNTITKMIPSQRKNFVSNFTQDADIYLRKLNKINSDGKVLSDLMKNCVITLKNLGDEEEILNAINNIKKDIIYNNNKRDEKINEIALIKNKKENFNNIADGELYIQLSKKIDDIIFKLPEKYKNKSNFELQMIANNLNTELDMYKSTISLINDKIKFLEEQKDDKEEEYNNYILQISLLEKNINKEKNYKNIYESAYEEMNKTKECYNEFKDIVIGNIDSIRMVKTKYNELKDYIDSFTDVTENDIVRYYNIIDEIILQNNKILENNNKTIIELSSEIKYINEKIGDYSDSSKCAPSKNCYSMNCPYLKDEVDYLQLVEKKTLLKDKLIKYNKTTDTLTEKFKLLNDIKNIKNKNNQFISFMDSVDIGVKQYIKYNTNDSIVYIDNDKMNKLLNSINEVTVYINAEETFKVAQQSIEETEKINELKVKADTVYKKINMINKEMESTSKDNIINKITDIENNMYLLEEYIGFFNDYKQYGDIDKIKSTAESYITREEEYKSLKTLYNEKVSDLNNIDLDIKKLNETMENYNYKYKSIKYNINVKKLLEEYYIENKFMKDALSTNKGIPMVLVDTYLQKTRTYANKIILDAFDGELILEPFVINAKEFNIPLIKRDGEGIPDVSKASSGERAIVTLAISLAIYKQNKMKHKGIYNILALDELDGPLDVEKRRKFMKLIENEMEENDIDQLFNITHNNLFNDIPANLILFKGANIDVFTGKTVLYKYE